MSPARPSSSEDEYFARVECEKRRKIAEERQKKLSLEERESLKKLHWMRCPKCGMELNSIPYKDVTIDKCFNCRGIYLDDGELEKLAGTESGFLKGMLGLFKS